MSARAQLGGDVSDAGLEEPVRLSLRVCNDEGLIPPPDTGSWGRTPQLTMEEGACGAARDLLAAGVSQEEMLDNGARNMARAFGPDHAAAWKAQMKAQVASINLAVALGRPWRSAGKFTSQRVALVRRCRPRGEARPRRRRSSRQRRRDPVRQDDPDPAERVARRRFGHLRLLVDAHLVESRCWDEIDRQLRDRDERRLAS